MLVNKVFYSPHNKGASLVFTQVDNEILVTEFKDGAIVAPYQNLNCGTIEKIAGTTRGLSCTRGSIEIRIAMYKSKKDGKMHIVRPAFDYELENYHDTCEKIRFFDWAEDVPQAAPAQPAVTQTLP